MKRQGTGSAVSGASALTQEALRAREEEYQRDSLAFRPPRESDMRSCASGLSALSVGSVGSSRRSRPRRAQLICDVKLLMCELSAASLPTAAGMLASPPPSARTSSQGPRRFRVTMWHRSRRVADAPAAARLEKTQRGPVYRCSWASEDAKCTLATAVNRHNKLRPPLLLIFELFEDTPSKWGNCPSQEREALARNTVVLEEYHPGRRKGRVTLGTGAVVVIEVTFTVLTQPESAPPTPRPPSELSVEPPFGGSRGPTPAPDEDAGRATPGPGRYDNRRPRSYPTQRPEKPRAACRCSAGPNEEEPERQRPRRRGRVAFQTPHEEPPYSRRVRMQYDDHDEERNARYDPSGYTCSRGGDDARTPVNPCTKGAPSCEVQCAIQ